MAIKPEIVRKGFHRWFVGEENSEGEQRAYCPICEDPEVSSSPSAMMNPDADKWNCLKGNHGGTITSLVADLKRERGWDIRSEAVEARRTAPTASAGKQKPKGPPPSSESVMAWHDALLENPRALKAFISRRGIDMESIEEHEIGWDSSCGRYTLPVYDREGQLVNVRKYKMGASSTEQKFWNAQGYGDARPFRIDEEFIAADAVIVVEGEPDYILLKQMGFPCITFTGGSGTWKHEWNELFTDKAVYLAHDQDEAGEKGALKVANALRDFAVAVYRVKLPTPGSDVTDFFMEEGHDADDFEKLMASAAQAGSRTSRSASDMPTTGERASLLESMSDKFQNNPVELIVSVTGKLDEPFTAPRRITATCDMSKGVACETCPMLSRNGQMTVETQPHDPRLIEFIDVTSGTQNKLLRMVTGSRCSDRVQFEVEETWRVEELAVQNSIDERKDEEIATPTRRTVWSIGTFASQTNQKIGLVGRNVQDPKSGVLRFHSWINEPVDLDIDKFRLTPDIRERLEVFRPDAGQGALDKCQEIAADMSANVTSIIGRDLLHVGMDLVYHSPIAFNVHEKSVDKGWLEMIVVGDTRTGKSEIASRLMKHYGAGKLVSCEGVTFAGLIGGVQQINNRWHMTWGVIPMHDRRLVVLDEVSGMADKNIIEQMSSVRSAGIAEITKIANEATSARVRLIWITNPLDGKFLSENRLGGIGALLTVVPNMEDVARFDFAMASAKGDVSSTQINSDHRPGTPRYSSEDCEMLVKWSWSLGRENIKIADRAITAASRHAISLGERYTASPPLVQAENVRYKLLRIAAAMAARTFSVGRSGLLLVTQAHVNDAVAFLDAIYSQDSLGYGRISDEEIKRKQSSVDNLSNARMLMKQNPGVFNTLYMNSGGEFRVRDFGEFQGVSDQIASQISSKLHEWGLTKYLGRGVFMMTEQLVELLASLKEEEGKE